MLINQILTNSTYRIEGSEKICPSQWLFGCFPVFRWHRQPGLRSLENGNSTIPHGAHVHVPISLSL